MSGGNQDTAPLAEGIAAYAAGKPSRFHTPGHAGRMAPRTGWSRMAADTACLDITELPDLACGVSAEGLLVVAENLAAALFGAKRTFFSAGGSTLGLQAVILAMTRPGDAVLLPRNAHRSLIDGLVLSGARPVFLPVHLSSDGIPLGVTTDSLEKTLRMTPQARLLVLVHPSYQGLCSDLPALITIAHRYGLMVLVDEAHGSHFGFHTDFPRPAVHCGADAWVQSTHKTLGGLTGAAMLHLSRGARISEEMVARAKDVLASSSPSWLVLASIDETRRRMAIEGRSLWEHAIRVSRSMRRMVTDLPGGYCVGPGETGHCGVAEYDPTRIVFAVNGFTGNEIASVLRHAGLEPEYSDKGFVCLIVPYAIEEDDVQRLKHGLQLLGNHTSSEKPANNRRFELPALPPMAMVPREAVLSDTESVPLSRAEGRICATTLAPCPPGVPILCPGEEITRDCLEFIEQTIADGAMFDPVFRSQRRIMVVRG